jgi:flagellum-specific peptidoglycan hydrolase FlgJ
MLSPAQLNRLHDAALNAVACERSTEVPAELAVAQWALESNWGSRAPGNNCFGIKAYAGCYGVQLLQTYEVVNGVRVQVLEKFATFPTLAACFTKHSSLFKTAKPYAKAWAAYRLTHDLQTFVRQIAVVYASDPNYANLLLRIMAMPDVKSAVVQARTAV